MVEKLILEDVFLRLTGRWLDLMGKSLRLVDLIKSLPKTLSLVEAQKLVTKHCKALIPNVS